MNAKRDYIYTRIKKAAVGTATTGALLLFIGAAAPRYAHAQDQDEHHEMRERDRKGMEKCQRRTQKAEAKLTEEMREHGNRSPCVDGTSRATPALLHRVPPVVERTRSAMASG